MDTGMRFVESASRRKEQAGQYLAHDAYTYVCVVSEGMRGLGIERSFSSWLK